MSVRIDTRSLPVEMYASVIRVARTCARKAVRVVILAPNREAAQQIRAGFALHERIFIDVCAEE